MKVVAVLALTLCLSAALYLAALCTPALGNTTRVDYGIMCLVTGWLALLSMARQPDLALLGCAWIANFFYVASLCGTLLTILLRSAKIPSPGVIPLSLTTEAAVAALLLALLPALHADGVLDPPEPVTLLVGYDLWAASIATVFLGATAALALARFDTADYERWPERQRNSRY